MNCVKVQEAIWCGELTHEMQQHIATCEDCQSEQRKIQSLSFSLEHVQVPVQSRSLLPSKQEIEQTLRARKRQTFTKWGIGGAAAVACVLAAVMVVPTFFHSTTGRSSNSTTASVDPKMLTTEPPHTADIRIDTSNSKTSSDSTGQSSTTSPSQSATSSLSTPDQPFVTVNAGIDSKFVKQASDIRTALNKTFDTSMFKHIAIQQLEQDVQNSDGSNLSFVVTLLVQHQPGKGSAYGTGDVTTTRFAHFTNKKGMWSFDGLATSPVFLHAGGQTSDWHKVDVKNGNATAASLKVPSSIEAKSAADGSVTFTNQGKVMGMLEIEMQGPHTTGDYSHAVSLPNGAQVVDQQTVSNGKDYLHIVQYTLKYDAPTGSGTQPATGTRVYFMRDDKVVYDLSFPEGAVDADTLKQIINSFDITQS
jgi:hypothetical protein